MFVVTALGMLVSCATTMQAVGEAMVVQRIFEAQGTKSELYRYAYEWMAKSFGGFNDKDIDEKIIAEGIIAGRGIIEQTIGLLGLHSLNFWYILTVQVKENKARVTIEDIYGEDTIGGVNITVQTEEMRQKEYDELKAKFNALIDNFSAYMNQSTEEW